MNPLISKITDRTAALTYVLLLATIFSYTWFASTPLPLGGPNVILGGAAVLLALSCALARKRFVVVKNLIPLLAVALLLMIWAAIVHVFNDTGSWRPVGKMGLGIGILCAVYLTVTRADRAKVMIAAGILAALVSALFGLAMIYTGEPLWSVWFAITDPSKLQFIPV